VPVSAVSGAEESAGGSRQTRTEGGVRASVSVSAVGQDGRSACTAAVAAHPWLGRSGSAVTRGQGTEHAGEAPPETGSRPASHDGATSVGPPGRPTGQLVGEAVERRSADHLRMGRGRSADAGRGERRGEPEPDHPSGWSGGTERKTTSVVERVGPTGSLPGGSQPLGHGTSGLRVERDGVEERGKRTPRV
jgi:hypothetical protein